MKAPFDPMLDVDYLEADRLAHLAKDSPAVALKEAAHYHIKESRIPDVFADEFLTKLYDLLEGDKVRV